MKLINQYTVRSLVVFFSTLVILSAFSFDTLAQGLGGLDEVIRSKNPSVKKTSGSKKGPAGPKRGPKKAPKVSPEEIYENALDAGNVARDQGNYGAAERAYLEGISLKLRDSRAHYGLGNIYMDQQRWLDAEERYRSALAINRNDADINTALSFVLVQQDVALKLVEAERYAREATRLEPNNAVAFDRLGFALEKRGIKSDEAEEAFVHSTKIDPNFALAHAHLARLLWKKGKYKEAETSYQRATELAEAAKDVPTLSLIAGSYQSEQRFGESIPLLIKALDLDGKYPSALFLLGNAYAATKRFDEAIPVLKRCTERIPQAFGPHNLLASVYQRAGRLNEAEDAYDRAAKLASPAERAQVAGAYGFIGVGDAFLQMKRYTDAVRCYRKAEDLDPKNEEIKSKISLASRKNN